MSGRFGCGCDGMLPKYCSHQLLRLGSLEIARDHEHRIVRRVVGLEELRTRRPRWPLQIFERADQRMRALEIAEDQRRPVVDDGRVVRLVVEAQPPLLLDGFLLVLQILGVMARLRMRSDSSHSASASLLEGMVSK